MSAPMFRMFSLRKSGTKVHYRNSDVRLLNDISGIIAGDDCCVRVAIKCSTYQFRLDFLRAI